MKDEPIEDFQVAIRRTWLVNVHCKRSQIFTLANKIVNANPSKGYWQTEGPVNEPMRPHVEPKRKTESGVA